MAAELRQRSRSYSFVPARSAIWIAGSGSAGVNRRGLFHVQWMRLHHISFTSKEGVQ